MLCQDPEEERTAEEDLAVADLVEDHAEAEASEVDLVAVVDLEGHITEDITEALADRRQEDREEDITAEAVALDRLC